ncbi:hypothetical protein EV421DRAFT_1961668 [Armillaria borealis]|uniref:Fibronectin type-III domain-containing protein n=1 Tax=Armillaria borealis TaxID=47425 RepID=A0AA39IEG7_9AGAR|nr:hypothetical protein EV421DRAFT_1961668 [Armillaria borealis]
MIPMILFYASLFMYILPVPSLVITVPTQPPPRVNDSTSVLLTWTSAESDPSHFFIAVKNIFPPDLNVTSFIQPMENFAATRNVSLVFEYAGKTFIEAIKASPTAPDSNITFASSEPFQVDEGLANGISASFTSTITGSTMETSVTIPSTSTAATASSSSKHNHTAAVIAAVLSGIILLVLTAASVFIWRYHKRRNIARQGTFSTNFDDERQHIPTMPAFLNSIDEREHRASLGSPSDHSFDVPPPPYSLFIRE